MSEEMTKLYRKIVKGNTFVLNEGFEVLDVGEGRSEVRYHTNPEMHSNLRGDVHGGVHIAISDTAMGMACYSLGKKVTTLEINGNYIKPVRTGEVMTIRSRVVHDGSRTMLTVCDMYREDGAHVYTGRATFFVLEIFDVNKALADMREAIG